MVEGARLESVYAGDRIVGSNPILSAIHEINFMINKDNTVILVALKDELPINLLPGWNIQYTGVGKVNAAHKATRIVYKFKPENIINYGSAGSLNQKISGPISASLNLKLANATELPNSYSIFVYPISGGWTNGVGKGDDQPKDQSGCSWKYKDDGNEEWVTLGGDFITGTSGQVTYDINDDHDLEVDVTSIVSSHFSGSLSNDGMLLKINDDIENNLTASILLKYFSRDTNTVYPPYLEFKWDDTVYSSSLSELSTDIATVNIKNSKPQYIDSDIVRFRLTARPKYPTRTFSTSSVYLTEHKLPANSYWGIKDEYSGEMIVDFDTTYTKISADDTSSYLDVYMDSLQPERFYRLLIKTTLNNSTFVLDNKNIFKVVRHG